MKRTKQNVNQIHWGYWSNFFGNFLFGIVLVFAFSILVSLTDTNQSESGILLFEGIKKSYYLVPQYLSLTIAGALGGLLYSILLDGGLEMPGWGKDGKSLKTGSIGEVFVGIGGAFTTYIFIPDALTAATNPNREIIIFVFGLVGGYGGKAILNAALEKIKGRIGEADLVAEEKERLAHQVDQLNEEQGLIKLVTQQINQGLPPSEIYGLSGKIQNASEELQEQVFTMAKEIRRLSWRSKAAKAELMRTIPIFEALVNSDTTNDQYHAQLGYAYKDSDPPRLEDSISQINQAIELRGSHIVGNTSKYELNRALARIMAKAEQTLENGTTSPWREEILADLFTVDRNYGLAKVLLESEDEVVDIPLKRWLEKNEDWIKERSGGKSLLLKAFKVSQTPQSSNTREPLALAATSSSIGRLGLRRGVDSLKENATSGSLSTRSLRTRRRLRLNTVLNTEHLETAPPNTKIKATTKTYLKKQLIESSELLDNEKLPVLVGKEYKVLKYSEETNGHYLVELDYGAGIWYLYSDHWELPWKKDQQTETVTYPVFFTKDNLKKIMPHASSEKIDAYLEPINRVCHEFEINTAKRAAAYIAQVAHESCSLLYEEEIADGSAYEGRRDLGNTQRGDGKRYKGRGLIQVTGRYNYRDCGKALGLPLEEKPELLLKDPYTNALSTGWYWKSRNINAAADAGDFRKVTKLINGGTNGYADRCQFWERAKKYIPSNPISQTRVQVASTTSDQSFGDLKLGNDLASRIIKYMKTKGYQVFTNPKEYNIVYIEGMNRDGTLNDDRPNHFNDLRTVIEFTNGQPKIVGSWVATTEPGKRPTFYGKVAKTKGAARIKFGQYAAWIVGIHNSHKPNGHEALCQWGGNVTVHRDFNKDFKRTGDKEETGGFGINQHHGYDNSLTNVAGASAGCLVGRTVQGHREFMVIIKQDKRYQADKNYVFYTTIIPGDDLNEQFPPN